MAKVKEILGFSAFLGREQLFPFSRHIMRLKSVCPIHDSSMLRKILLFRSGYRKRLAHACLSRTLRAELMFTAWSFALV